MRLFAILAILAAMRWAYLDGAGVERAAFLMWCGIAVVFVAADFICEKVISRRG